MKTKQVIVLRKFEDCPIGKYCSQAAHASMSFLTSDMTVEGLVLEDYDEFGADVGYVLSTKRLDPHVPEIDDWLRNSFKKVVVYVETDEELVALHEKALTQGLLSHLITDNGTTVFDGVPTRTALAIGPAEESKFINLTDHLPLL